MYAVPNHYGSKSPQNRWTVDSRSKRALRRQSTLLLICIISFLFLFYRAFSHSKKTEGSPDTAAKPDLRRLRSSRIKPSTGSDGPPKPPEASVKIDVEADEEPSWKGWSSVENIFIFGDSYSNTYFEPSKEQPSPQNPLGNMAWGYPTFVQRTRWPVDLTTKHNDSFIRTFNFARSGSVVDRNPVDLEGPPGVSIIQQLELMFLPSYVDFDMKVSDWKKTPETSLFVVFIGINDNIKINEGGRAKDKGLQPLLLERYEEFMHRLYDAGARNFLIMDCPPLDRYPEPLPNLGLSVRNWNRVVHEMAQRLRDSWADKPSPSASSSDFPSQKSDLDRPASLNKTPHPPTSSATILEFSTHAFFSAVKDDHTQFPQTKHYKNTTTWCGEYGGEWESYDRKIEEDAFHKRCEFALQDYLHWDKIHLTNGAHAALAEQVAAFLRAVSPEKKGLLEGEVSAAMGTGEMKDQGNSAASGTAAEKKGGASPESGDKSTTTDSVTPKKSKEKTAGLRWAVPDSPGAEGSNADSKELRAKKRRKPTRKEEQVAEKPRIGG